MPVSRPLLAALLAATFAAVACGDDPPTPTAPTATATPTPAPTPPPPPPAVAELESVTLNPERVTSQGNPEGTVRLTAAAPSAGAVVTLSNDNADIVQVPSSVTVAAGSTTGTFQMVTSTVNSERAAVITARYAGVSKSATLTVLPPPLEANFTVTSTSRGNDACEITTSGGMVDCVLNARSSRGVISRYYWTLKISSTEFAFSVPDEQGEVTPNTSCGFLGNGSASDGKVSMEVSLYVEDRAGNKSSTSRRTVDLYHNGRCGH